MDSYRRTFALTTLLCVTASIAHAQPGSPAAGTTLRLTMRGQPSYVLGTVASTSPTTWTLTRPNGSDSAYALSDVALAETRVTHRRTLRGALIGGGVGLAGAVALIAFDDSDDACDGAAFPCIQLPDEGFKAAVLIGGPLVGAGAGALIGSLFKTTRWVPTVVPRTAVGATRIGVTWHFR